jgi:hypothetical protein
MTRALLESLPPPATGEDFARVREIVAARRRKLVVLDDDPTGTQRVHGIPVLTEWSVEPLVAALLETGPAFYILTNTRALDATAAVALNREVAANLRRASEQAQRTFDLASRSDSTLRGHRRETRAGPCTPRRGKTGARTCEQRTRARGGRMSRRIAAPQRT